MNCMVRLMSLKAGLNKVIISVNFLSSPNTLLTLNAFLNETDILSQF